MDDNFYPCLGQRVRQARREAGMTQALLAARVGLTRASVTNIEKGRQKVLAHTLWRLAETLGVSPEDLVQEVAIVANEAPSRLSVTS
jgi:transcriptional regulator with XRE-family HTH domain